MGHTKCRKGKCISLIADQIHKVLVLVLIIIKTPKNHDSEVYILFQALAPKNISPYNCYVVLKNCLEYNIFFKEK